MQRQAIIWTNNGILLIGPLGTNLSEILIKLYTFAFKKMHLKMLCGNWCPFCLGLNVLISDAIWLHGSWLILAQVMACCLMAPSHYLNHDFWPAHRAGLLWSNFFGQPGSVSKFPPFLCVKLWVGWVGRGYIEISRYFPALWINRDTLVTKIKLWYSLGY